jgi:hypothetical protein
VVCGTQKKKQNVLVENNLKTMNKMEESELEFMFFMKGTSGSFMTNLFKTIMSADITNQKKLSIGFPNEVEVVRRYQNEDGYWQKLQKQFE